MIIPRTQRDVEVTVARRRVKLTNLDKVFWSESNITKGDLLQYYADVSPALLPHLRDRAMVMKRYPTEAPSFRLRAGDMAGGRTRLRHRRLSHR